MLSIESLCGGYKNVKTDKKDKIAKPSTFQFYDLPCVR